MQDWRFLPLPGEEWREIPGTDGYYAVSSWGRVRREKSGPRTSAGSILRTERQNAYGLLAMSVPGQKRRAMHVHRALALAFLGPATGRVVNHKNGVKNDTRVANLEWCTVAENNAHARNVLRVGNLLLPGSAHPGSKLTEANIAEIVLMREAGDFQRVIADRFGVAEITIRQICRGSLWKHLPDNERPRAGHVVALRGVTHGMARLSEADVLDIRARVRNGEMQRAIARAYSITAANVWRIARRITWRHIP